MDVMKSIIGPTSIEVLPEAEANKERLPKAVKELPETTTPQDLQQLALIGSEIHGLLKGVEDTRKTIKAPILKAGKVVDGTTNAYIKELEEALEALSARVLEYRIAEEDKRLEEAGQQHTEALAKAAHEAQWASNWLDPSREPNDAEKTRIAHCRAKYEALLRTLPPVSTKVAGVSVGKRLKYRVVDKVLLYAARPDLAKIEPIPSAIQDAIFLGCNIPGLEVWEATSVNFSS